MPVYLIHLHQPLAHARHYIGYAHTSTSLEARLQHHRDGNGSRFMQVVTERLITWEVVQVWPDGDRTFERRLKNQKHSWRHCPICRQERGLPPPKSP